MLALALSEAFIKCIRNLIARQRSYRSAKYSEKKYPIDSTKSYSFQQKSAQKNSLQTKDDR